MVSKKDASANNAMRPGSAYGDRSATLINDYGRQRDPGGQRVASEEVQGHTCPAEAYSYQGATNIGRDDCGREARAKDVLEPEELTECPNHDEELNRDSYLSPAFSSHGDILAGRTTLGDKLPFRFRQTRSNRLSPD